MVSVPLPCPRGHAGVQLQHTRAELLELQPAESIEVVGHGTPKCVADGRSAPVFSNDRYVVPADPFAQAQGQSRAARPGARDAPGGRGLRLPDVRGPRHRPPRADRGDARSDHLSIAHAVEEAGEARGARHPRGAAVRAAGVQGRGGLGRLGRGGRSSSRPCARSRTPTPTCWSSAMSACASTPATATAASCTSARRHGRRQRRDAGAPRRARRSSQARAGADIVAPERHDGRPRRRDPRRARRRRLHRHADHVLRGEVRLGLLRPVPRAPPTARPRSATGAATRWTRPTAARPCARRASTWTRAPTSSWSSRRCPTST